MIGPFKMILPVSFSSEVQVEFVGTIRRLRLSVLRMDAQNKVLHVEKGSLCGLALCTFVSSRTFLAFGKKPEAVSP